MSAIRRQRSYDHRLREVIRENGNITVAADKLERGKREARAARLEANRARECTVCMEGAVMA